MCFLSFFLVIKITQHATLCPQIIIFHLRNGSVTHCQHMYHKLWNMLGAEKAFRPIRPWPKEVSQRRSSSKKDDRCFSLGAICSFAFVAVVLLPRPYPIAVAVLEGKQFVIVL